MQEMPQVFQNLHSQYICFGTFTVQVHIKPDVAANSRKDDKDHIGRFSARDIYPAVVKRR